MDKGKLTSGLGGVTGDGDGSGVGSCVGCDMYATGKDKLEHK